MEGDPMLGGIDKKWLAIGLLAGVVVAYKVLPRVAPQVASKLGR